MLLYKGLFEGQQRDKRITEQLRKKNAYDVSTSAFTTSTFTIGIRVLFGKI